MRVGWESDGSHGDRGEEAVNRTEAIAVARWSKGWGQRAWPTEVQRPGESLMEWSRRLDVQDNVAAGAAKGET